MSSKKGLRKNTKPMIHVIGKNGNAQEIPDCRKSKERYIEQANEIWRGKYDYTNSDYKGNKEPITIFCPRHNYHFRVAMAQNGAPGFFRGRPPQTMHDSISKGIDLCFCQKRCTFAPYFIKV